MRQDKGLQVDNQVFVRRKNKVVSELYSALEILAAAFGGKLDFVLLRKTIFVVMLVFETMQARLHSSETARQMMLLSTIVEFHVPTY